jgi:5-methylcytosine-specific restriction protein A
MPSYRCKWPNCRAYVPRSGSYCQDHEQHGREARADRDRYYDQHLRDEDARRFYNSKAWELAREKKLATTPICERCNREWARHVHHKKPLKFCTVEERTAQSNLKSLCHPCHNEEEAEAKR